MQNNNPSPQTDIEKAIERVEHEIEITSDADLRNEISLVSDISTILTELKRLQSVESVFLKEHSHTCIHHTDAERKDAHCPVCLKQKLQSVEKERDELFKKIERLVSATGQENLSGVCTLIEVLHKQLSTANQRVKELEGDIARIKCNRLLEVIKHICEHCGHTVNEDGCAFCLQSKFATVEKELKELRIKHEK